MQKWLRLNLAPITLVLGWSLFCALGGAFVYPIALILGLVILIAMPGAFIPFVFLSSFAYALTNLHV